MTFDKLTDCIWALRLAGQEDHEFANFIEQCNDVGFLRGFFTKNKDKLKYFKVSVNNAVEDTIEDIEYLENELLCGQLPDNIFEALGASDSNVFLLQRNKAKRKDRKGHDCWIRIYAIRLGPNYYIVTGGAIKLTQTMKEAKCTKDELLKLDKCRDFLKENSVCDEEGLKDFLL